MEKGSCWLGGFLGDSVDFARGWDARRQRN